MKLTSDLDGLALVIIDQGVGATGRTGYVRVFGAVVANPLVAVGDVGQTVGVGDSRGLCSQRFAYLGGPADGGYASCREFAVETSSPATLTVTVTSSCSSPSLARTLSS